MLYLQHGAKLILMCAVFKKISGLYGIIAIFTGSLPSPPAISRLTHHRPGAETSALQRSLFFYPIIAFATLISLLPNMHKQSPLAAIFFAYIYLIDSIINALYTFLFGLSWFLVQASIQDPSEVPERHLQTQTGLKPTCSDPQRPWQERGGEGPVLVHRSAPA
jgi:hypothetical protein